MENLDVTKKKKTSVGKIILYIFLGFIGIGILGAIFGKEEGSNTKTAESTSASSETEANKSVGLGEVLKTEYFDVTANKMVVVPKINTGNEYTDVKAEEGSKFLIIDVSFKNTDTESRMVMDGDILVNYSGKDYKFDKPETIIADGFGTMLDQINPLITKKTKIVYKIPTELTGKVYWNPGRSDSDQVIYLGDI